MTIIKGRDKLILVTGGCGFIGSNFVLEWIQKIQEPVVVLDKLTYAGNVLNLEDILDNPLFHFIEGDINNKALIATLLEQYSPRAILNFAAESHVDKSIRHPENFIQTNIHGTFSLLEAARTYWSRLNTTDAQTFRFLQISTDEVYGSLTPSSPSFTEKTPYQPNNPYSASKAAADHLVNAYHHTYGLPTLITNCSNNYGPYQYPEKLIPLVILSALNNTFIPIYGDGQQIRDWLYVSDHCSALRTVLNQGRAGETYNIGSYNEKTNLDVVKTVCHILDSLQPSNKLQSYESLITFVKDRPGHDKRYSIDAKKISHELNWKASETFESGIQKTVQWYLNHLSWTTNIQQKGTYQQWVKTNYELKETV